MVVLVVEIPRERLKCTTSVVNAFVPFIPLFTELRFVSFEGYIASIFMMSCVC